MTNPVTHFMDRIGAALEEVRTSNALANDLIAEHKSVNEELSAIEESDSDESEQMDELRSRRAELEYELLDLLRAHMQV
jgi:uncharacterized protein YdcH (DUF465 family)